VAAFKKRGGGSGEGERGNKKKLSRKLKLGGVKAKKGEPAWEAISLTPNNTRSMGKITITRKGGRLLLPKACRKKVRGRVGGTVRNQKKIGGRERGNDKGNT